MSQDGSLIDVFKQVQVNTFDLGAAIKNIDPLLKTKLNLANGRMVVKYGSALFIGGTIGTNLRKLANWSFSPNAPKSTPSSTQTSDPSSSSTTTSTTSTSARPSETTKIYAIETYRGTTQAEFESLTHTLPNAGQGLRITYPSIDFQVYGSRLTESQAETLRKNPIIEAVVDDSFVDDSTFNDDLYSVIPKHIQPRVDPNPNLNLAQQSISPYHLNLISQGPRNAAARRSDHPQVVPDYLLSPKAGEGTTIFIMDTGLNPSHPVGYHLYTKKLWLLTT